MTILPQLHHLQPHSLSRNMKIRNPGAVLIAVFLCILEGVRGAQKSPTFSGPDSWPCNPKCDGKTYDPSKECCADDTILSLKHINLCGPSCTYRPCFELCCPESYSAKKKFVVKLKVHGKRSHCSSSPVSRNCASKRRHGADIEENKLCLRGESGAQVDFRVYAVTNQEA